MAYAAEDLDDVDVAPTEVGGDPQRTGARVHQAGQGEAYTGHGYFADGGDGRTEHVGQLRQHAVRFAVAVIPRIHPLDQDVAGEIEHPDAEVIDVHLEPDGGQGPGRGHQRLGGTTGFERANERQFGHQTGLDQLVGQRRNGGLGQPGALRDVGPRWGRGPVRNLSEHDTQIVFAQRRLAGGIAFPSTGRRNSGICRHGVDDTRIRG